MRQTHCAPVMLQQADKGAAPALQCSRFWLLKPAGFKFHSRPSRLAVLIGSFLLSSLLSLPAAALEVTQTVTGPASPQSLSGITEDLDIVVSADGEAAVSPAADSGSFEITAWSEGDGGAVDININSTAGRGIVSEGYTASATAESPTLTINADGNVSVHGADQALQLSDDRGLNIYADEGIYFSSDTAAADDSIIEIAGSSAGELIVSADTISISGRESGTGITSTVSGTTASTADPTRAISAHTDLSITGVNRGITAQSAVGQLSLSSQEGDISIYAAGDGSDSIYAAAASDGSALSLSAQSGSVNLSAVYQGSEEVRNMGLYAQGSGTLLSVQASAELSLSAEATRGPLYALLAENDATLSARGYEVSVLASGSGNYVYGAYAAADTAEDDAITSVTAYEGGSIDLDAVGYGSDVVAAAAAGANGVVSVAAYDDTDTEDEVRSVDIDLGAVGYSADAVFALRADGGTVSVNAGYGSVSLSASADSGLSAALYAAEGGTVSTIGGDITAAASGSGDADVYTLYAADDAVISQTASQDRLQVTAQGSGANSAAAYAQSDSSISLNAADGTVVLSAENYSSDAAAAAAARADSGASVSINADNAELQASSSAGTVYGTDAEGGSVVSVNVNSFTAQATGSGDTEVYGLYADDTTGSGEDAGSVLSVVAADSAAVTASGSGAVTAAVAAFNDSSVTVDASSGTVTLMAQHSGSSSGDTSGVQSGSSGAVTLRADDLSVIAETDADAAGGSVRGLNAQGDSTISATTGSAAISASGGGSSADVYVLYAADTAADADGAVIRLTAEDANLEITASGAGSVVQGVSATNRSMAVLTAESGSIVVSADNSSTSSAAESTGLYVQGSEAMIVSEASGAIAVAAGSAGGTLYGARAEDGGLIVGEAGSVSVTAAGSSDADVYGLYAADESPSGSMIIETAADGDIELQASGSSSTVMGAAAVNNAMILLEAESGGVTAAAANQSQDSAARTYTLYASNSADFLASGGETSMVETTATGTVSVSAEGAGGQVAAMLAENGGMIVGEAGAVAVTATGNGADEVYGMYASDSTDAGSMIIETASSGDVTVSVTADAAQTAAVAAAGSGMVLLNAEEGDIVVSASGQSEGAAAVTSGLLADGSEAQLNTTPEVGGVQVSVSGTAGSVRGLSALNGGLIMSGDSEEYIVLDNLQVQASGTGSAEVIGLYSDADNEGSDGSMILETTVNAQKITASGEGEFTAAASARGNSMMLLTSEDSDLTFTSSGHGSAAEVRTIALHAADSNAMILTASDEGSLNVSAEAASGTAAGILAEYEAMIIGTSSEVVITASGAAESQAVYGAAAQSGGLVSQTYTGDAQITVTHESDPHAAAAVYAGGDGSSVSMTADWGGDLLLTANGGQGYSVQAADGGYVDLDAGYVETSGAVYASGRSEEGSSAQININGSYVALSSATAVESADLTEGLEVIATVYADNSGVVNIYELGDAETVLAADTSVDADASDTSDTDADADDTETAAGNTQQSVLFWAYNGGEVNIYPDSSGTTLRSSDGGYVAAAGSFNTTAAAAESSEAADQETASGEGEEAAETLVASTNIFYRFGTAIVGNVIALFGGEVNIDPDADSSSASLDYSGEVLAVNGGTANVTLNSASTLAGTINNYTYADAAYTDVGANLPQSYYLFGSESSGVVDSAGTANLTMSDYAVWYMTGSSFVSNIVTPDRGEADNLFSLSGSLPTIVLPSQLTGSGGYALYADSISGSANFMMHLDSDPQYSDMLYFGQASGSYLIWLDSVLSEEEIGDGIHFARVGNSDGYYFNIWHASDGGVFNYQYVLEQQAAGSDTIGSSYDTGENKPGTDFVNDRFGSDDGSLVEWLITGVQKVVSDVGRAVLLSARAMYFNAVSLDSFNKRMSASHYVDPAQQQGLRVSARYNSVGKDHEFSSDNTRITIGYDHRLYNDPYGGMWLLGGELEYQYTDTDYRGISGSGNTDRYGAAFYATYLSQSMSSGPYADIVLRYGHMKTDFKGYSPLQDMHVHGSFDNDVFSLSGEFGWKFRHSTGWFVEPQIQLQGTYLTSDSYTTSLGNRVKLDDVFSLISRVGFRAGREFYLMGSPITAYVRADLMHEWLGDQKVRVADSSGSLHHTYHNDDTWYGVGLGVAMTPFSNAYFYVEAERVMGASFKNTYVISIGGRVKF